jgi:hypothetical protein
MATLFDDYLQVPVAFGVKEGRLLFRLKAYVLFLPVAARHSSEKK